MENSIYLGLSRQMTLQTNMEIIANNVANMNTSGFRAQNLIFDEFVSDPRGADDPLSFSLDEGHYQITAPGSLSVTGNQLDIALEGPGFLGVQAPNGDTAYTRDGGFSLAPGGGLVSSSGFPILDAGGGPITIPAGSSEIKIDQRGFISNQDGQIAQLLISEFDNIQEMEAIGNNQYITDAEPLPSDDTVVSQGQLEGSNVKPVIEMTRMIDTLRAFQSVQNVLQSENERLRGAIQKLTQGG